MLKNNLKRCNKDQRHHSDHSDDEGRQSGGRRARRHSPSTTATVFSKTFVTLCLLIQLFFVVKAESFVQNHPSTGLSSSSSQIKKNPPPEPWRSATAQKRRRTCTSRRETCRAKSANGFGKSSRVPFVPVNHISRGSSLFSSAGTRSTNSMRILRNTRDVSLRGGASGLGGPDVNGRVASQVIAVSVRKLVASITKSKTKCWIVLFLSIAGETAAASLSKYSRVTGKLIFLFIAIVLNLIPYVSSMLSFMFLST